ncbi:hypothetical protein [Actinoplanes sp. G11-F43]|uniref:hypothetical protein n=1 Tax=Actinoplanes sp. G11-F43 TaxID=3424130 RepID=UPI003D34157E
MSGRVSYAELNAVRALVADSLADLGAAGDSGQVWIRSAWARLSALDSVLTEVAGVLAAPVQVLAATVVTFLVVVLSAALASAAGLSAAGVLGTAGLAVLAVLGAAPWAGRRAAATIGRRRLARAPGARPAVARTPPPAPLRFTVTGRKDETGTRSGGDRELPDRLLHARGRLVSVALRRAGVDDWTVPALRRAIRTDPVIRRLAHADQLLCQAIDCVERHLGEDVS